MGKWLYLIVGSVAGGVARYVLAGAVQEKLSGGFPFGTMIVNIAGCFLVGFFSTAVDEKFFLGPHSRMFLMTGFCGAFTTFSTYMLETSDLMKSGEMTKAFLNIFVSTAVGIGVYMLGVHIGSKTH